MSDENHCRDCCCARSWTALGVSSYTGKSIPEHISELKAVLDTTVEALECLLPGLVLDLRYASDDDDKDAMRSRIKTVTDALAKTIVSSADSELPR